MKTIGKHMKTIGTHMKTIGKHMNAIGKHMKTIGTHMKTKVKHMKTLENTKGIYGLCSLGFGYFFFIGYAWHSNEFSGHSRSTS